MTTKLSDSISKLVEAIIYSAVSLAVLYYGWNCLAPEFKLPQLTFWRAAVLNAVCGVLFKDSYYLRHILKAVDKK